MYVIVTYIIIMTCVCVCLSVCLSVCLCLCLCVLCCRVKASAKQKRRYKYELFKKQKVTSGHNLWLLDVVFDCCLVLNSGDETDEKDHQVLSGRPRRSGQEDGRRVRDVCVCVCV